MSGNSEAPKGLKHTPFAGCSIVIAAAVVMIFLVGFTIWNLFRLNSEIEKFTESEAQITQPLDPLEFENEFNDLSRRLDGFHTQLELKQPNSIALSPTDINLAISAHDVFEDLKGAFFVSGITENEMLIDVAYPMNRAPLSKESGHRYLNGTFHAVPRLTEGQILLDIKSIDSLKGTVPPQFVAQLSEHQITAPYLEHPKLGPLMKQLSGVSLKNGALVLHADPENIPPSKDPTLEDAWDGLKKFAIIFGGIFLLMAIFVVVFLSRKKGAQT